MIIQQDANDAAYQIQRYEPGKIWINQQIYQDSIIIRPTRLLVPWEPRKLSDLRHEHFESIYEDPPEILLLGTGAWATLPSQALIFSFLERQIGVEFMDSRAACFTYTILAGEERKVAACILNCDT